LLDRRLTLGFVAFRNLNLLSELPAELRAPIAMKVALSYGAFRVLGIENSPGQDVLAFNVPLEIR
jgi:hypothetical protein